MKRQLFLLVVGVSSGCGGTGEFSVERTLPFPADTVYQTAMDRFGDAHRISPHLHHVEYLGNATAPTVGVQRQVWTTDAMDTWMKEELLVVDPDARRTRIAIIDAEGVPVNTEETFVESVVTPIDDESCLWTTTMTLRTTPAFLRTFAQGGVRSDMEDMLIGLEHHIGTGEDITPELFDTIEADYR